MDSGFKACLRIALYYGFFGPILGCFILVPGTFLFQWLMSVIKTGRLVVVVDYLGVFILAPFLALLFAHVLMGVPALMTGFVMYFVRQQPLFNLQLVSVCCGFVSAVIWGWVIGLDNVFAWYYLGLTGALVALMLTMRRFAGGQVS